MKKWIALLLLAAMALALVPAALAAEPVTLKFMSTNANLDAVCQYFNEQSEDIKLEFEYVTGSWPELNQKLLTMIAGGTPPDIVYMAEPMLMSYVYNDQLLDITEYVERDLNMDDYIEGVFNSSIVDGKNYGIPIDVRVTALFYNKDLYDAKGVAYPNPDWENAWSIEEWLEVCKQLSGERDGQKTFGHTVDWRWVRNLQFFHALGLESPFNEDGSANINSPEAKQIYTMLQDMVMDGSAASPSDLSAMHWSQRFRDGILGGFITGNWEYYTFEDMGDKLGFAPTPGGQTNFFIDSYCIFKQTDNPDAAWEVLKFLASEDFGMWLMDNAKWACFPIRNDVMEVAKDKLFPVLKGEEREAFFDSVNYAHTFVSHRAYNELIASMGEVTGLIALGEISADEGLDQVQENWTDIIDNY